jgi:3-phenylpropionate/cinnamic acid dioxygenase small subunit
MSEADDRFAIIAVLDRYAEVLDRRSWSGLADVFTDDIDMDFGTWHATNLEQVTSHIRSFLDGCGPSQHLLGNYRIELDGDTARSRCYIRVMHFGRDEHEGKTYEMWGEYRDVLVRTPQGWRSRRRRAHPWMQQGDITLLGPGRTEERGRS